MAAMLTSGLKLVCHHVLSLCLSALAISSEVQVPSIGEVCPYNTFCTHGPVNYGLTPSTKPCCGQCSCHPDCWTIGSCCADIDVGQLTGSLLGQDQLPIPCKSQYDLYNIDREIIFDSAITKYRVIDKCFNGGANESCFDPENIEDYIMVSDISDEFVFKNHKCAICNGFPNVTRWNLGVHCTEVITMSFESAEELNAYIVSNCKIQSLPPKLNTGLKSYCHRHVLDSCPTTMDAEEDQQGLSQLCKAFKQTYTYSVKEAGVYNNIFCFMCNNRDLIPSNICPRDVEDDERIYLPMHYFSAILSPVFLSTVSTRHGRCKSNEFADHFTAESVICRRLTCPLGYLPREGDCQAITQITNGYTISNFVWIRVSENLATAFKQTPMKNKPYTDAVRDLVLQQFGVAALNCEVCGLFVLKSTDFEMNNNLFLVQWTVTTSRTCNLRELWQRLASRRGQSIHATLALPSVIGHVIMNGTVEHSVSTSGMKGVIVHLYQRCEKTIGISHLDSLLECPRVHVTEDDFERHGLNITSLVREESDDQNYIPQVRPGTQNGSYLVCTKFFFALFNAQSSTLYAHDVFLLFVLILLTICFQWSYA